MADECGPDGGPVLERTTEVGSTGDARRFVLLQNADSAGHTVDLRITVDGHDRTERRVVPASSGATVDVDRDGPLRVEVYVDHGGTAAVGADVTDATTAAEFTVLADSVVVSPTA